MWCWSIPAVHPTSLHPPVVHVRLLNVVWGSCSRDTQLLHMNSYRWSATLWGRACICHLQVTDLVELSDCVLIKYCWISFAYLTFSNTKSETTFCSQPFYSLQIILYKSIIFKAWDHAILILKEEFIFHLEWSPGLSPWVLSLLLECTLSRTSWGTRPFSCSHSLSELRTVPPKVWKAGGCLQFLICCIRHFRLLKSGRLPSHLHCTVQFSPISFDMCLLEIEAPQVSFLLRCELSCPFCVFFSVTINVYQDLITTPCCKEVGFGLRLPSVPFTDHRPDTVFLGWTGPHLSGCHA